MTAVFVTGLLSTGPTAAQDAGAVFLEATYLAAPTDWCTAETGVPMIVKMDGPDIIRGPSVIPRTVAERRGGKLSITHTAENIASFNPPETFDGPNADVIGRFAAEFQSCLSAFGPSRATGAWSLTGPDGLEMESGAFENEALGVPLSVPFFQPVSGPVTNYYAQFGERLLFTSGSPEAKTKQTFLAEPDKE